MTSAEVDLGKDEYACLQINASGSWAHARSIYRREGNHTYDNIRGTTIEQAMLAVADRWPKATLRLDSITVKGSKTVRGAKLKELAAAA